MFLAIVVAFCPRETEATRPAATRALKSSRGRVTIGVPHQRASTPVVCALKSWMLESVHRLCWREPQSHRRVYEDVC
eukprot:756197-Hanusia_phi.AAC.2